MANKWRDEDFNRYSEEEIRRHRARGYDEPRQYSQDYTNAPQYGADNDHRDRGYRQAQRDRLRYAAPDMTNQRDTEELAQPGTFYYGGSPQRRFGQEQTASQYEDDIAPDIYGRQSLRDYTSSPSYNYRSSYATDSARIDANFRDMGRFERGTTYEDDYHPETRTRGIFSNDDPKKGPIDRMRNWMSHRGKGPKGYTRSDDRIRDDISDHLTQDHHVDASHIEISVKDCECTLNGTVATRDEKRHAEDIAERVMGVKHVQNNLRVAPTSTSALSTQDRTGTMSTTVGTNPTLSALKNNSY